MGRILLLAGILLVSGAVAPALGATWYVDGSVASSGDGTSAETALKRIQEGIDAAKDGDTVIVTQGTYVENIQFKGKNIVLRSTDPSDPSVVESTIIDGNQAGSVVTFDGTEDETCVLSGFTIQNGSPMAPFPDEGWGINGGSRYGDHTHATIQNNVIAGNSAHLGGGLASCAGVIQNNTISGNTADGGGGLDSCHGTIQNNTITDNSAVDGGGLYWCDGTIRNNTISGNSAALHGGGLHSCNGTIQNNVITGNSVTEGWATGGGLDSCHGTIQNNTISGNSADWADGGGLYGCRGTIQNNTIAGNSAYYGGGLEGCNGTIQNNTISGNSAYSAGGGLYWCNGIIQNNTIVGNSAQFDGGGLHDCDRIIQNNTISGNSAGDSGGGLYSRFGEIVNCILWGNTAPEGAELHESSEPGYSCIAGWPGGGAWNIADDPQFVDPDGPDDDPQTYEDNDYRLSGASPCIDAGRNDGWMWAAVDLDGNPPISRATVDMGAYEYLFRISHVQKTLDSRAVLVWISCPGDTSTIWSGVDLSAENPWREEATIPSAGETTTWTDPDTTSTRKFYRIEIE